ncbi:MAG TPA: hypothetical protein VMS17_33700 [Gemmataceae bacterium]|nr:hypothetical protein [Gemmataceae bacterium]
MATYTVITYKCPRCRADIGRRFGLHTKLSIACPNCGNTVRISRDVIQQNWGFNFAWISGLLLWLILGVGVLADRDLAAAIGRNSFPSDTMQDRLMIAGVCALPAFLGGLLIGGIGMVLGTFVAAGAAKDEANAPTPGAWPQPGGGSALPPFLPGQQRLQTTAPGCSAQPYPGVAPTPQAPKRNIFLRTFFVLLWPIVFFIGAALVLAAVARSTVKTEEAPPPVSAAGTVGLIGSPLGQGPLLVVASVAPPEVRDEAAKQQATKSLAEKAAPWLLLGTVVVFGLGCAGLAPLTGRKKCRRAAQPSEAELRGDYGR